MKGLGVAMAVGSAVAAASATMGTNKHNQGMKKNATKAVQAVEHFVDNVSSMMK